MASRGRYGSHYLREIAATADGVIATGTGHLHEDTDVIGRVRALSCCRGRHGAVVGRPSRRAAAPALDRCCLPSRRARAARPGAQWPAAYQQPAGAQLVVEQLCAATSRRGAARGVARGVARPGAPQSQRSERGLARQRPLCGFAHTLWPTRQPPQQGGRREVLHLEWTPRLADGLSLDHK